MRLGITIKLFLGVLAISTLAAIVMAVTMRLKFEHDFVRYVEDSENYRIESLADTLAAIYADTGDWQVLEGADRRWNALLRSTPRFEEGPEIVSVGPERGWPHVALYDTDDHPIVGYVGASGETVRKPVEVDGRVVGWIARARWAGPTDPTDLEFQGGLLRSFTIATLIAVLVAAGAAALLARSFLAPARAIGEATHRLTAGDFGVRVKVGTNDEFGRLGDDFNLLAATLQHNEGMRRRMMADVAHELRTPLAVIQGELAAIEDGVRPLGPDSIRSLQVEAHALGKLIDDLHQLSLADVGALDYRRIDLDLRRDVAEILEPIRERCSQRGLILDTSGVAGPPLMVHADPERLAQLLNNLLENAMRYTDAPGTIAVSCRQEGRYSILQIEDSPPGVDAEHLPHLFERFYRADTSRSRALGGTGLGLAICRNIVEAHEGRIDAAVSVLGGLAIVVMLPSLRSGA